MFLNSTIIKTLSVFLVMYKIFLFLKIFKRKNQTNKQSLHGNINRNFNCSLAIRECIGLPYLALGLVLILMAISSLPH